jgi:hypothetical protein
MSTAIATAAPAAADIERVLIDGDLSRLTEPQRLAYYNQVCSSLGLNPLTKPFAYIKLSGKLVLYALKDATEQLRKIHGVSITELSSQKIEDVFVVTAKAQDKTGRTDAATGAVAVGNQKGDNLANALMKAETKAKRRVTLSICGLGMLDETELETIKSAEPLLPTPKPIALPDGTWQVISVQMTQWGGEVTLVDKDGLEVVHKTNERKLAELCEQIAQEAVPVTLEFVTISRGVNTGKTKLTAVHRYVAPAAAPAPEPPAGAALTADDIPFMWLVGFMLPALSILRPF